MKPAPFDNFLGHTALISVLLSLASAQALAEPTLFKGADLTQGEQLIAQGKCTQCHVTKVGGNGNAIYRPNGKISEPGLLRGMVEQCNTALNLQMFPDEVTNVAAVLNRDHYKFK